MLQFQIVIKAVIKELMEGFFAVLTKRFI